MRVLITVILLGSAFVPTVKADFPTDSETMNVLDGDLPIVLTPSRLPQRIDESPSTVTVIDQAMIEASGARRLAEVFRLVPGFHVGYKYNNQPTVAYHGLTDEFARRLLLLIDGQRIFQFSRGAIDWNNLPIQLEDIERIEVVRGPNAAAYGSNAFAAVINLQTRSAAESRGLYSRVAGGSDEIADGFFRYGGRLGPVDYALSLASKGDDGYDHVHDDRRNNSISLLGEVPVGVAGELRFRAGYSEGDYEAQNVNPLAPGFERDFSVTDSFQSLQWRQSLGRYDELLLNLSHSSFHHGDKGFLIKDAFPDLILKIDYQMEEDRYEAELQYSKWFSKKWRTVSGIGYYRDNARAPFYFNTDDWLDTEVYRVFGHGEYRPREDVVINAGAMLEWSDLSEKWLFLPRLSGHYHISDDQTARLVFSTGSRQPTLYENQGRAVVRGVNVPLTIYRVFATGIDRGDLDPEINRLVELGYFWRPYKQASLDLRLFQEHISDLIRGFPRHAPELLTALPGNRVLDFENDRDVTIRGLEVQLDWAIRSKTQVFTSYAFTDIDGEDIDYDASAPRHGFGLLINQDLGNQWQMSLNYDYQSAMTWFLEEPIDDYHKLDVRIARPFRLGNVDLIGEIVGTNLLESVDDYLPTREWDRGIFARLAAEY